MSGTVWLESGGRLSIGEAMLHSIRDVRVDPPQDAYAAAVFGPAIEFLTMCPHKIGGGTFIKNATNTMGVVVWPTAESGCLGPRVRVEIPSPQEDVTIFLTSREDVPLS